MTVRARGGSCGLQTDRVCRPQHLLGLRCPVEGVSTLAALSADDAASRSWLGASITIWADSVVDSVVSPFR